MAGATNMLARYHEAVTPIAQVTAPGPILGRTASGTLVLPAPVDYIAWLERVGAAANRPDLQAPEKVLFVSGRLTPLAQKELSKRGWKIFEAFTTAAAQ